MRGYVNEGDAWRTHEGKRRGADYVRALNPKGKREKSKQRLLVIDHRLLAEHTWLLRDLITLHSD